MKDQILTEKLSTDRESIIKENFSSNKNVLVNDDLHSKKSNVSFTFENWIEYYLILIGYVIGFGSFWRFPYLIFTNGGGIFVLVFSIILVFLGIPIFYLECYLGQLYQRGPVETFMKISNKFKGVGWAMVLTTWLLSLYYCIILVWAYYYLFASFSSPLPWSNFGKTDDKGNPLPAINTQYFREVVLSLSPGIEELGSFNPRQFLCLIITYVSIFICIRHGIHSSSKVVYVTAPAPLLMMIILFFK